MEVLRASCVVFLDVSIIKVWDQNIHDYSRVRENVESEFVFINNQLSDVGFKKSVSRCIKDERYRLHKLYMTEPDRGCSSKKQPEVWERLKTYWNSPDFAKVKKVGSMRTQTATSPNNVPVRARPCSIFPF